MIDLHCHILPGLDDGAQTLEDSLAMARLALKDGIDTIVATPHLFKGGATLPEEDSFAGKKRELESALQGERIAVSLKMGAEVRVSHTLMSEVERNRKRLVINDSAYMFIEFPTDHVFPSVRGLVFELMSAGVLPIIAHPERNAVLARRPELLYDLVRMGALAQANRGSFLGLYGRMAADAAGLFLKYNLIHFIASDGHNTGSLAPILSDAVKRAELLVGSEGALALVDANPRAVLEDREVPYLPSPVDPRKSKKSFHLRVKGLFKGEGRSRRGSVDNRDDMT